MKYLIAISILFLLIACKSKKKIAIINPDVFYTCSMHPQIMQDQPGNCPICGMKLIQVEKKKGTDADAIMLSDQQIQLGNIRVDTLGKGIIGDETVLTATLNIDETKATTVSARVSEELISSGLKTREIILAKDKNSTNCIVKNSIMPNRNTF
jgi:Cu(I)/Ag(I) efflux system membrane fusion protein